MIDLLDEFTSKFADYIKNITNKKSEVYNENIARELGDANLVITFNYSDTIELYKLSPNTKVFHINGSLNDSDLPIIGYHLTPTHNSSSVDYLEKFFNVYYSKPALAYKRNTVNYNLRYKNFIKPFSKK